MKYYLKMAWRNIWRNKRRTFITTASIVFAILFAILMRAIQLGSYQNMIDNVVQAYTGYIQVFHKEYQDEKIIDNSILLSDELLEDIEAHKNVTLTVPRLESFALASSGNQTKGIMLVGTDLQKEDELTSLSKKLVEGEYLKPGQKGILVSERLASFLNSGVGDTVVLISQGYHGIGAADQYRVQGIIKFPSPDMDNKTIFMDLSNSQEFYSAPNLVSSISVNLDEEKHMNRVVKDLQVSLGKEYDVKSWEKILTKLVQQIEGDNVGGLVMLVILYMIVGFGVFGTVQMMTAERRKEFGVMVAVGMQKIRLGGILIVEMIFIGLIGTILGIIITVPIVYNLHIHPIKIAGEAAKSIAEWGMEPIMPAAWEAGYFFNQAGIVLIIVCIAVFFPIMSVTKLKVSKALRA